MENAVAVFTSVRSKANCNTSFGPLEVAVCYDMFMETTYLVLGIQMVMAVFPRILLRFESSNKDSHLGFSLRLEGYLRAAEDGSPQPQI